MEEYNPHHPAGLDCAAVANIASEASDNDGICRVNNVNIVYTIIDVRPYSDYVVGHIVGAFTARLSSILLRRLCKGKMKVLDLLLKEQKEVFLARQASGEQHRVIVYDGNSEEYNEAAPADMKNPLHAVLKSLMNDGHECAFVIGGMDHFLEDHEDLLDVTLDVPADKPPVSSLKEPLSLSQNLKTPERLRNARDPEPTQILPFLWIGGKNHAHDVDLLKRIGITHVLNMTSTCKNLFPDSFTYKTIPILDTWNQNLLTYFEEGFQFIDAAKETQGRILVHCVAGISRSPTITIAYIMWKQNVNLSEAFQLVKSKRNIVSPNLDFMGELAEYEKRLGLTSPDSNLLVLQCSSPTDEDDRKEDSNFSFGIPAQ